MTGIKAREIQRAEVTDISVTYDAGAQTSSKRPQGPRAAGRHGLNDETMPGDVASTSGMTSATDEECSSDCDDSGASSNENGSDAGPIADPDPLFDPDADDRDEAYITKQRKGHDSDAILSCPSCFATLSVSCQQHERYHNQFRAMFVQNCQLRAPEGLDLHRTGGHGKQRKRQKQQEMQQIASTVEDINVPPSVPQFCPVLCDVCDSEVGVFDQKEELYHFFHVLASQP